MPHVTPRRSMNLISAAVALVALTVARPHAVHALETTSSRDDRAVLAQAAASTREPTATQAREVNWRGPMEGDIWKVLRGYYIRVMSPSTLRPGCRADEGELCFGGDPEDQGCRVSPCREPEDTDDFLTELAEAVAAQPGDALAIGQAVYAYARLADFEDALALAGECAVASWWCEMLLGMVHDRAGRPAEAESRFRSALHGADTALASRLMAVGELLGDADRPEYHRLTGRDRADFEQRFWWLTDPLWSIPGNDRWTAHIRRRFELVLHEQLLVALDAEHTRRHESYVVRRGHEDSWSAASMPAPRWTSLQAARYRFTPVSAFADGLGALRYDIEADRTDERYTPASYGPVFQLPAQFARFREGDSLVVAAAADLGEAPLAGPETVFMVSDGPGSFPVVLQATPGEARPVFETVIANGAVAVGIESLDGHRAAARARGGLLPLGSGRLVLSDPLLMTPAGTDLAESRDVAVARMLGTTTVEAGGELAVYWEVYGAAVTWPLRVSLSVEGARPGLFTRALRALRLRSAPRVPVVSWTQTATAVVEPMALAVDIANLETGEYTLKIEVSGPDGSVAESRRQFRVEPEPPR